MDGFLRIGITREKIFPGEASMIESYLKDGTLDYVHIRKPEEDTDKVRRLISGIDPEAHCRLRLHDHFMLFGEFGLAGVHLNRRNPDAPEGCISVTRSCHTLEELKDIGRYSYVALSPIFDSISKMGYVSKFRLDELPAALAGKRVVALGGVTPEAFPALREAGFIGAAMLGWLW